VLELLKNSYPLYLAGPAMDKRLAKAFCVCLCFRAREGVLPLWSCGVGTYLQSKNVVRKHNYFISPILVELNKELAGLKLVRVHAVQQHALPRLLS
jgi:hypothetical protein